VQIDTPKHNKNTPAVTTNQSGQQVAEADRVVVFRSGKNGCDLGDVLRVTGTVFSPHAATSTFGLTTANNGIVFVQTDGSTRFDEPFTGFGSLTTGSAVNVFALPPLTVGGPLRALLVDEAAAPGTIEARGIVSNHDASAKTFVVSGITFCYSAVCTGTTPTQFVGFGSVSLANGQFVEVRGTAPAAPGGTSAALRVELEADPRPSSCSDGKGTDDDKS
jgi:hypothetical protein